MNIIDRVILEWSYKTKKGYPDINSQEDMDLFESMFGFNISERKGENEAKIISQLVSRFPGKYGKMSDPIRIANKEGIDSNEFIKDLKSVTNSEIEIKSIPPKTSPNPSGKYFFFQFNYEENEIGILLASGGNKGNKFETVVANDLQKFKEGDKDFTYQSLIEKMIKEFKLTPTNFEIKEEGSRNQKRPLIFTPEGPLLGTPIKSDGDAQSIAETLTDLTLIVNNKPIYISLKFGSTLTFFNPGVKKIFTEEDIKSGKIKTESGIALLETLGIDNELFCRVFNEYREDGSGTNFSEYHKLANADPEKLYNLLHSGIGHGYYMLKGSDSGDTNLFLVTEEYVKKASRPTSGVTIRYGGKGGTAKRIDIVFTTAVYRMTLNIRSKSKKVAPTNMMGDYKPI
jgi:hypothetical protein